MKLSIKERVIFSGILPQVGTIVSQIVVKGIIEKVQLSKEDAEKAKLQEVALPGGQKGLKWDENKVAEKEVVFTEAELAVMREQIDSLDSQKKISQELLPLCLKIKNAEA